VLGQRIHVRHGGAGVVEVAGEDQRVGGLADAVLLGGLELGGAELVERLDDPAVGLCAFIVHMHQGPSRRVIVSL
jgi:hypothetical protein